MKKLLIQLITTFFYCNFFVAACAASLIYETDYLLHLLPGNYWFALLIFFCTFNIYNFHYYLKSSNPGLDKRLIWFKNNKQLILALLILGSVAIIYLIIFHFKILFSDKNIFWTLLIPFLSLAYSFPFLPGGKALRHFGWLKLPLLSFVWTFSTVMLPVFFSEISTHNQSQIWVLFINRLFFITALAVLFNVRDYHEDKKDRIFTPAVFLGTKKTLQYGKWIFGLINISTALLLAWYFDFHGIVQYLALIIPAVLLFLLFHYYRFDRGKMVFALLHDGLIPVKVLLIFGTLLY